MPKAPADVDLLQQIDSRLGPLVDERLQARWPSLIEPLLADLRRDLHERLLAETRRLLETRIAETRTALEALLVSEQTAAQARLDTITSELQSVNRLAEEPLPDLVTIADGVVEQVRANQARVYLGILAAALSGVLAAALVYILLR